MPDCAAIDRLVTPYVDRELESDDHALVESHLHACPRCRHRVTSERAVRALMQESRPVFERDRASEMLRARCAGHARAIVPVQPPRALAGWRGRAVRYGLAASITLVAGSALVYWLTNVSSRVMAAELAADHMKCFFVSGGPGSSGDRAAAQRALSASLGVDIRLPADAARAGLDLVGLRPCLYGEGRVAHIMYRHNGIPVSLFVLPRERRSDELMEVMGHNAAIWTDGDHTFVLVGREPRAEIERIATLVHGGNR